MLWDPQMEHTREVERLNYFYHRYYGGSLIISYLDAILLSFFLGWIWSARGIWDLRTASSNGEMLSTWFVKIKYPFSGIYAQHFARRAVKK